MTAYQIYIYTALLVTQSCKKIRLDTWIQPHCRKILPVTLITMTVYISSLLSLTSVITVITFIICLVQILRTLTCVINNFCHNGINAENGLCSRVHLDLGNAEMRNITGNGTGSYMHSIDIFLFSCSNSKSFNLHADEP